MLFKVTNKGPARTIDFLGVFAEGETREFTVDEVELFQHMSGVGLPSSILADENEFDVEVITEAEEGK